MTEKDEVSERWTELSDNFNTYVLDEFATDRPAKWLRKITENAPGKEVLDIFDAGCGPGFFSILLDKAGHHVTGMDASARMLEHARENACVLDDAPVFLEGDFGRLSFPDHSFDLVVSRNVTHVIKEHLRVYGEWYRILRPGGVLLIFDANWHLPYVPGPVREEAIRREYLCLEKYGSGYTHDGSYEYIDSDYMPDYYRVFGYAQRPDFDMGVLAQLPFKNVSFERNVTEELWSEKEKLAYSATPLFMIRAEK